MTPPRRLLILAALVSGLVLLPAGAATAHPLGNFTVNHYSGLRIQHDRVLVDHVVDMAELPAFQARQEIDTDGNGVVSAAEAAAYRDGACARQLAGLELRLDGRPIPLRHTGARLSFPPGVGGLATMRLECALAAQTGPLDGERELAYLDASFAGRVGWREVTAVGDGTTLLGADVPANSISARLTRYPKNLLQSPLDQRRATLRIRPGGPRTAAAGASSPPRGGLTGADRATGALAALVAQQQLSLAVGLAAVLIAALLGALHTLAPGHGKTVMAAYLVAERGSLRQALGIGLIVAATHTTGVLVLALVLSASTTIAPERLYPWLGVAGGALLTGVGGMLLGRALGRRGASPRRSTARLDSPPSRPGHASQDHGHLHGHRRDHPHDPAGSRPLGWRSLVTMGFAGGLLPSPSALIVLLAAAALGRAWFGATLVVAYGAGMAAALTGLGLVLVQARGAMDQTAAGLQVSWPVWVNNALPVVTASLIVVIGIVLAAHGAAGI